MSDTSASDGTARAVWRQPTWRIGVIVIVLAAALTVALLATREGSTDGDGPQVGASAPDFFAPTLDGGTFSLSDHVAGDGRPVFLNLWAAWCFPCREEMPAIDAVAASHPEVHFIGVVVDDDEAPAREFVEQRGIGYQIALDESRQVKQGYQVWAMPSTFLIDRDGMIVRRIFGPLDTGELEALVAELTGAN